MTSESTVPFSEAAVAAFAGLCARLEAGEAVDVPQFLAAHRELRPEIEALLENRRRVKSLFESLAADSRLLDSAMRSAAGSPSPVDEHSRAVLDRLANYRSAQSRYLIEGVVASGGMGVVLRVRDRATERELAMKVLGAHTSGIDGGRLRRFLDEAELTAQLDHPGIVPVHEIGVDDQGRAFFTMPLVKGESLARGLEALQRGDPAWSEARALEVLLKVCDAVAFAHESGVVHRDLKPENVLVGRFGQVYVMDWGLARAEPRGGLDDPVATATSAAEDASLTLDGDVLGTPAYMAPEQAEGRQSEVGPRSDVYALGAILYHVLAGRLPYGEAGAKKSSREVLEAARRGPPPDAATIQPDVALELAAICRKAMARRIDERYRDVSALADDLRSYMEGRVVGAYERGAWAELRKWVRRNRGLAGSIAALVLVLVAGLALVARVEQSRNDETRAHSAEIQRQSDVRGIVTLRDAAELLWPAVPDNVPALEAWLRDARDLASRVEGYRSELAALRARARPAVSDSAEEKRARDRIQARIDELDVQIRGREADIRDMLEHSSGIGRDQGIDATRGELGALAALAARWRRKLEERQTWAMDDPLDAAREEQLARIVQGFDDLVDPSGNLIAGVESRLQFARTSKARSIDDVAGVWRETIEAIADPKRSPRYMGLRIRPQLGLVPLGRDPASGLFEFAHLATGAVPSRDPQGNLRPSPEHGLVFVLVPPGRLVFGAAELAGLPSDEPRAKTDSPFHVVDLDAFFLSKYEMTQAQWTRVAGLNPSYFRVGTHFPDDLDRDPKLTCTLSNPVDQVSWFDCERVLQRVALVLPTEAQWEYACRADTRGAWSLGNAVEDLFGKVNISSGPGTGVPADGYKVPAPVDTLVPNPWGFFHIHGNVGEWVQDWFWTTLAFEHRRGDGLQLSPDSRLKLCRGGNFWSPPEGVQTNARQDQPPTTVARNIGVRPARRLDP